MAEDTSKSDLERKTILATLEELKKAFEAGEITEEEYGEFKKHYDDALAELGAGGEPAPAEAPLEEPAPVEEAKEEAEAVPEVPVEEAPPIEEPKVEEAPAEEPAPVEEVAPAEAPVEEPAPAEPEAEDYGKMSWKELQKVAKDRGLTVLGKGRTREVVEEELRKLDRGEPIGVEEAPAEEEYFPEILEEGLEVREIDPAIKSNVAMVKKELQSLKSKLSTLKVRRKVSESTLKNLKTNFEKKLIDTATYEKLSKKYEGEPKKYASEIKKVEAEIKSRKDAVAKYAELLKLQSERADEIRGEEEDLSEMETELKFIDSTKLYILSEVKDYLNSTIEELDGIQKEMFGADVVLPAEASIKAAESEMKQDEKLSKELKAKLDNFQALVKSLDEEKKKGEIDAEAYSVLKGEYTKEGSRVKMKLSEIERSLRMKRTEVETYSNLKESVEGCKEIVDSARKAFESIWLDSQRKVKGNEIKAKSAEMEKLRKKANSEIKKTEGQIKDLVEKL